MCDLSRRMERTFSPLHSFQSIPGAFVALRPRLGWDRPLALKTGTSDSQILVRGSIIYPIKHLIGIMFEYSNPCFLKNSWDSALILSVSRVMRKNFFCFAKSIT